jgi:NitT/TauT family transport system substrate-binding protein
MKRSAFKKVLVVALAAALVSAFMLVGCSSQSESASDASGESSEVTEATTEDALSADANAQASAEVTAAADALRIVSMKGATSVGLASMMNQNQGQFTVVESADKVSPLLLQDDADIVLVPANVAATLYQKTEGGIQVIDVNTLGVLYVVTGDETIDSVAALKGKTLYMTGKGTTPEYTLKALLAKQGLSFDDVDVQFKSEPSEVAALLAADETAIGILPQPYATALTIKDANVKMTVDLSKAWEESMGAEAGSFVTAVTIAKKSFIQENPQVILEFLERHAASVTVAEDDPAAIAQTVVDKGIIESTALAEKAIPYCNAVCLTGEEMKTALSGYLQQLYDQDASAVGGALPADDFYYLGE